MTFYARSKQVRHDATLTDTAVMTNGVTGKQRYKGALVRDNGDGTFTVSGPAVVAGSRPGTFTVVNPDN